jgi:hypothetical protein
MRQKVALTIVVIIAIIVGSVAAFLILTPSPQQQSVTALAVLPDGTRSTSATYKVGDNVTILVSVPANSHPLSIQWVSNGVAGSVTNWDISNAATFAFHTVVSTAYSSHVSYAKVTFSDGSIVQSNNVTTSVIA